MNEINSRPRGQYIPPPPPHSGYIRIIAPVDEKGRAKYSNLHLTPDDAEALRDALAEGLADYMLYESG